jgi:multiple sugar transport system permease protein
MTGILNTPTPVASPQPFTAPLRTIAPRRGGARRAARAIPTILLLGGALYALYPILWIGIASTKTPAELFTTSTMLPSFTGGFLDNVSTLLNRDGGLFLSWAGNSVIFAGGGALLSTLVSAAAGYGLAKYRFRGRLVAMILLVAGIMVPGVMLVIPQYLLLSQFGLAGTYLSVLLPSIISPLGIFLAMVYAQSAVPDELVEAGRLDGASELTIFIRIAFAPLMPGLVTVFLLQFVGIWNNFLLPYVMLADSKTFPLTVGLYALLNQGSTEPALYNLAIVGSFLSIVPLIVVFIVLQRYWKLDLISGSLKG